jgi:hypothetical protein
MKLDIPHTGAGIDLLGGVMRNAIRSIINMPEFNIGAFSFLLHFVWEAVQAPAYAGMIEMNHWDGIKLCMSATFGDVGFALTAFIVTSIVTRSRYWLFGPKLWHVMLYLTVGVIIPTFLCAGPIPNLCRSCHLLERASALSYNG